jgi:hypothetical protein
MYLGPPIDDSGILEALPAELSNLLRQANGYVAYHGGLHVRGACHEPGWHSLRAAWYGPQAVHRLFPAVHVADIPFGEDALGNQFVLREGVVKRVDAETGELESLEVDLAAFDAATRADPIGYLALQPLERFRAEGGVLEPGQLLKVYPRFVFRESGRGVSFRAISAADRLGFLSELAHALGDLPDGTTLTIPPPPPVSSRDGA